MNYQKFLRRAATTAITAAFTSASLQAAELPHCPYPSQLTDNAENMVKAIRDRLSPYGLMASDRAIEDFFADVSDLYDAVITDAQVITDELDEAAEILSDPACYVADPPPGMNDCYYFEAWKYFSGQRALALYPQNSDRTFSSLQDNDKLRVVEGTVAYSNMLMNVFPTLLQRLETTGDLLAYTDALSTQYTQMHNTMLATNACPVDPSPLPDENAPIATTPPQKEPGPPAIPVAGQPVMQVAALNL